MFFGRQHHSDYKVKHSLEERRRQSENILSKHMNYIPCVVDCDEKKIHLKKKKFLVPRNVNCSHLVSAIRSQIKLEGNKAVFLFAGNEIVCPTESVSSAYERYLKNYGDEGDKFFYICLEYENTFG